MQSPSLPRPRARTLLCRSRWVSLLLAALLLTPGAASAFWPFDAGQPLDLPELFSSQPPASELAAMQGEITTLAEALVRNLANPDPESGDLEGGLVVCTFVELKRLSRTSSLGRHVAEQLLREMQQRHYGVIELRKGQVVRVDERLGEFGLTRDSAEISQSVEAGAMLTGTYSVVEDGVVLNARIIDSRSGRLLSTATTVMPRNPLANELLADSATARTAKPAPMYMKRLEL